MRTGAASVHPDNEHPGYFIVFVWSQRGNMQAWQRLDRAGLERLKRDIDRELVGPYKQPDNAQPCGCDIDAGIGPCKWCVADAEKFVGARIRDRHGREWTVNEIGEKNALVTLRGDMYWAYAEDDITVIEEGRP